MGQERILIVDDDLTFSEMLTRRLESRDYLVDCAHSGNAALDILEMRWIDLIIMGLVLQGTINGFRLVGEIKNKQRFSRIPIIIQSNKAGMKKTFEAMGVDAFFTKPYAIEELLETIDALLKKK
ncbi:MAG: response regulator transcription factor [Candidatus Omnitrophica bacterium]|nr:response regulator transcription factor [Candidatus Omnitrophota bacterium]